MKSLGARLFLDRGCANYFEAALGRDCIARRFWAENLRMTPRVRRRGCHIVGSFAKALTVTRDTSADEDVPVARAHQAMRAASSRRQKSLRVKVNRAGS